MTWAPGEEPQIERYWSLDAVIEAGRAAPFQGDEQDAADALEALLSDAIAGRMVADVPLGAFLSGGIDSSTVVALMQAQSTRRVRSFSIGFDEPGYDEAQHAAAVARHIGTDHTELYVRPQEAREVIPELPQFFDEPFSDSSQIPTYLVSRMTREHVTVALSGDGGDELFGGYQRYLDAHKLGRIMYAPPKALRGLAAGAVRTLSPKAWDGLFNLLPASRRPDEPGHKMHVLAGLLRGDRDDLYRRMISLWDQPETVAIGAAEPKGLVWDPSVARRLPDHIDRMMYLDTLTYMPDDILTKVDRASMAVSLEARVPLIDHRVVAFAWSLPRRMKVRDGEGKWLLRKVLDRHVPRELIDRPKMGFGVPIDDWLRGPLRDWAESLLSVESLQRTGLLRPEPVRERWLDHICGRRNWKYHIWDILMLQAWSERWG
jgi:asparagine synthase (glutamine-hydrolysing)